MRKSIIVTVDESSWPSGKSAPQSLTDLRDASPVSIDVRKALLFAGIWTRPPELHGFHLSDRWAWLRYFPAIADVPSLRLCEPWEAIDPHQKTILSDDFGVGFSTWILHKHLGLTHFADTLHVVRVLDPGKFFLLPSKKQGPRKSPDFVGYAANGDITVVECKGTQKSTSALDKALIRGVAQKKNLKATGGSKITHSLVTGVFVPQWSNSDSAHFAVRDPDLDVLSRELIRYELPDIRRAVIQVAFAKELALFNFANTAGYLVHAPNFSTDISQAHQNDLREAEEQQREAFRLEEIYFFPGGGFDNDDQRVTGVRFSANLPTDRVENILRARSPREAGQILLEAQAEGMWQEETSASSVLLISPSGAHYRLELLT